jgi:hypothetical protein
VLEGQDEDGDDDGDDIARLRDDVKNDDGKLMSHGHNVETNFKRRKEEKKA